MADLDEILGKLEEPSMRTAVSYLEAITPETCHLETLQTAYLRPGDVLWFPISRVWTEKVVNGMSAGFRVPATYVPVDASDRFAKFVEFYPQIST
jgi:hypothetical protein